MRPILRNGGLLATALAAAVPVAAQHQATTLADGVDRAAVVVVATVTATTDPSPEWHRLQLRTDETLKGQPGAEFALLEPAGACCGRALFALRPGNRCLLLLLRTGATLHPLGGSRGVVEPTPELLGHVRALLGSNGVQRTALLAASLTHPEPRIALDAAHALAGSPTLALTGAAAAEVGTALQRAVRRRLTSAVDLTAIAVRSGDPQLLDTALALYVSTADRGQQRLLSAGLARAEPARLTARLAGHLAGGDPTAELRAAELLRLLPDGDGLPALGALLARTSSPRVQLAAAEALIAAGASPRELGANVPAVVLDLARRRVRARSFRAVDPTPR
ncbi:MAG: hypothetical protein KDE27_13865 [Planctomycetes bacterium]|nr:hypothetical protein [Planctomycetota bacterium]